MKKKRELLCGNQKKNNNENELLCGNRKKEKLKIPNGSNVVTERKKNLKYPMEVDYTHYIHMLLYLLDDGIFMR
jgi:hypothetical protein